MVNALSKNLECWVKRGGKEYNISFKDGKARSKLEVVGDVGKNNTGTTRALLARSEVLRDRQFLACRSSSTCCAPRRCCAPACASRSKIEQSGEKDEWFYTGGVNEYLLEELGKGEWLPPEMFSGNVAGEQEAAEWAVAWRLDGGTRVEESYVNLIPTPQGGTHVNGLRVGLTDAVREFCEFRNLLPRA